MTPPSPTRENIQPDYALFLSELAKTSFSGEIRGDFASRIITATDNSIYQILPQAVVFPRNSQDVVYLLQLANQKQFQNITFSPRGGGTGTNGQSLSSGIIIDLSKYMREILELNLEAGWVRVQPGVILDQLNSYLQPHGVFFAPNLSPSNRATLGGMINTDACGKGSRIYGRTSNHILELEWVLADGTLGKSQSVPMASFEQLQRQPGRLGEIYRQVGEIVTQKQELIKQQFPKMPRFMTGYNLAKVYSPQENKFNLNWILAGSEGTLALITEAKLKLTPIPHYTKLLAVHYACFDDALNDAQNLLKYSPAAIETIDETILQLAQEDEIYYRVKDFIGNAKAINLVEFVGNNLQQLEGQITAVCQGNSTGYYVAKNEAEINNLWALRKKGVGLLGNRPSNRKPIAFLEDTAVPPENLPSYIQEFKQLLDSYQLYYAMYGHVDVGCVHVRPALDTKIPQDEELIRALSDQVVHLVHKYGGVMWGEHGKGFRSEYTPVFFGDELYQDLRKIKAAFDPNSRFNPGKIVTPYGNDTETVKLEAPLRGHFDRQVDANLQSEYEVAFSCNGNGACFNFNPDSVMCPSYKGMSDRIHSPKGRASLLREWLRLWADGEVGNWGSGELGKWGDGEKEDFSHQVYEAMAGCLGCKACATQCPIHVDIPSLKAKFLQLYHTRYPRPWQDYLLANMETIACWQSLYPRLCNLLSQNSLTRGLVKQVFGLVDIPVASELTLREGLRRRGIKVCRSKEEFFAELSSLSEKQRQKSVILIQDAFTSSYESPLVLDTYDLLTLLGYKVYVAPLFPSGKIFHGLGFLDEFSAIAQRNLEYLHKLGKLNIPLVGIEPSIVLTYRDEYLTVSNVSNSSRTLSKVLLLQEFLVEFENKGLQGALYSHYEDDTSIPSRSAKYHLLTHCTEKSLALAGEAQWQDVFRARGLELQIESVGCCGMAGIYGHQALNQATSQAIFPQSWGQHLPKNPEQKKYFLATGFSCRSQVKRLAGWLPLHPVQILRKLL